MIDLPVLLSLIFVAIFVGVLIGGVGIGGVLLLPILTYGFDINIHNAIAAAMFGYIFSGFVAATIYSNKGSINWILAFWLILGGMPGAFLGAFFSAKMTGVFLEVIIAVLIIFAGIKPLISSGTERRSDGFLRPVTLIMVGIITGIGSALTGTGGPLLLVPILVTLRVAAHTAIGLSQAIQLPVASVATIGNYLYSEINLLLSILIAFGLTIGGIIGAKLAHKISSKILTTILGWVLLFVGVFIISKLSLQYII